MKMSGGGRSTRTWMCWAFKIRGCEEPGCDFKPQSVEDMKRMHCDHRDPTTKIRNGTRNLYGSSGGLEYANTNEELLWELQKCDPVCERHHIERTRKRGREARERVIGQATLEWIREPVRSIEAGEQTTIHEGHHSGAGMA